MWSKGALQLVTLVDVHLVRDHRNRHSCPPFSFHAYLGHYGLSLTNIGGQVCASHCITSTRAIAPTAIYYELADSSSQLLSYRSN